MWKLCLKEFSNISRSIVHWLATNFFFERFWISHFKKIYVRVPVSFSVTSLQSPSKSLCSQVWRHKLKLVTTVQTPNREQLANSQLATRNVLSSLLRNSAFHHVHKAYHPYAHMHWYPRTSFHTHNSQSLSVYIPPYLSYSPFHHHCPNYTSSACSLAAWASATAFRQHGTARHSIGMS